MRRVPTLRREPSICVDRSNAMVALGTASTGTARTTFSESAPRREPSISPSRRAPTARRDPSISTSPISGAKRADRAERSSAIVAFGTARTGTARSVFLGERGPDPSMPFRPDPSISMSTDPPPPRVGHAGDRGACATNAAARGARTSCVAPRKAEAAGAMFGSATASAWSKARL